MPSRRRSVLAALLLLLPCLAAAAARDAGPVVSATLARVLEQGGPAVGSDGRLSVWVAFTDRGLDDAGLQRALARLEQGLDDHARRRRARAGRDRLVDASDLPPSPRYLAAVAATGARLRRQSRWLNAASWDATPDQVRAIARLPFVRRVWLVGKARRRPLPTEPGEAAAVAARNRELRAAKDAWSIDYGNSLAQLEQIGVPPVHEEGYTGQGVRIGMLDSGFHTGHEALAGLTVVAAWDFVGNDGNVDTEPGDPVNAHEHGTMTLSTIMADLPGKLVGPAFGAEVVLARTEDVSTEEPFEEDNWVAGIEWLDSQGVDVVSSSLGYLDWYVFDDMDGNTAACTIAADRAVGKGIVVVNSAGNERGSSWDHIIAPADGDSVIAVGAVTISGTYTTFSSPGPTADGRIKPDVAALGSGDAVVDPNDDTAYTTASGTSFSCPLTAGVAALVLCRAPGLSPVQVREALRQTASRADAPDNDYGWGIVNAAAAVHYWGPTLAHAPLGDTEDTTGPYTVTCAVTDRAPLDAAALLLSWRVDGGAWQQVPLAPAGGDTFTAAIPGQPPGSDVEYYLSAGDSLGIVVTDPATAPAATYGFHVGPDLTPPTLTHAPLSDQPLLAWPPTVVAAATDNIAVAAVTVAWSLDGTPQADFALVPQGDDTYAAPFPLDVSGVAVGDTIVYTVRAVDTAADPNATTSGPHVFAVIDALGLALVIDDTGVAKAAGSAPPKPGPDKTLQPAAAAAAADSPGDIAAWLNAAGYVTDLVTVEQLQEDDFAGKQFVVLASGANTDPVVSAPLRALVEQWVDGGGKLLVEGGETGFDALSTPGYAVFAADVLHATAWRGDSAGELQLVAGAATHPLVTTPHVLPQVLPLDYSAYGDQDAVTPAADATLLYETAGYAGAAGILAYDDDTAPASGQIVVLAFNLAALADQAVARDLVENVAAWFTADQGTPTASLAGRVWLAAGGLPTPVEGATVRISAGDTVTTGPDGAYAFTDLYPGTYVVEATADGLSRARQTVTLAEGEQLADADLYLQPVLLTVFTATPSLPIPDDDPAGIVSTVEVPSLGALSEVAVGVEIRHTWIGDLTVELVSPAGTTVRLHDRSGGSADDIVGLYPDSLAVDGPGSLDDLVGELPAGTWTLRVADHVGNDTGSLEEWRLLLTTVQDGTAVPGAVPPSTRLVGVHPNPFNPRAEIRFVLARPCAPRLEVFDLRGRLVRRLLAGRELPAGAHRATWDGRDDAGRGVAGGTYLVRLEAGETVETRKVVLAR